MDILNLWVLVCCALSCACARTAPDFREEAAGLLRRIRMTPARAALVPAVIDDVLHVMQPRYPGCKAELFGSIAAGLGIIESDVDVSIDFRYDDPATNRTDAELVLETEAVILQHPHMFEVIKTIPLTRVPIITVRHLSSGFNMDISFRNYNGVRNSKLVHHLMSLDERARDLSQILKYWGKIHQLTGRTMLPSYGVVTLAIFYLQQKQILPTIASLQTNADKFIVNHWNMGFTENEYENKNEDSLCALLGGFFRFYSEFNFDDYIISPYVGKAIEIDQFREWSSVPDEFYMYRMNMRLNTTSPLLLKPPLIQDMFVHNSNLACRVLRPERRALVEGAIKYAAEQYTDGCSGYVNAILY